VRRWIWLAIPVVIGLAAIAALGDVRQLTARLRDFALIVNASRERMSISAWRS